MFSGLGSLLSTYILEIGEIGSIFEAAGIRTVTVGRLGRRDPNLSVPLSPGVSGIAGYI